MNKTRIHYPIITEEIETELRHIQKKMVYLILRKLPEVFESHLMRSINDSLFSNFLCERICQQFIFVISSIKKDKNIH